MPARRAARNCRPAGFASESYGKAGKRSGRARFDSLPLPKQGASALHGVEKVFQGDAATFLEGSSSTFQITRVRRIGGDLAFLDLDHDVRNCRMPDGSRGDLKIHLVLLARKEGDQWRWLDARPYKFAENPQPLH